MQVERAPRKKSPSQTPRRKKEPRRKKRGRGRRAPGGSWSQLPKEVSGERRADSAALWPGLCESGGVESQSGHVRARRGETRHGGNRTIMIYDQEAHTP